MTLASMSAIKILLVDDHEVMRCGLRMLLDSHPGMHVVSETTTQALTLEAAGREQPDVILLDIDLGEESGLEIIPALLEAAPATRIIVLTGMRDAELHRQAVHLGAVGLVLKEQPPRLLLQAIEHVFAGRAWLDTGLVSNVVTDLARSRGGEDPNPEIEKVAALTERERVVISLICEGLPNKLIAERMALSETTVRHYLTSIFAKLALDSRLELVIYAFRQGLVTIPERPICAPIQAR